MMMAIIMMMTNMIIIINDWNEYDNHYKWLKWRFSLCLDPLTFADLWHGRRFYLAEKVALAISQPFTATAMLHFVFLIAVLTCVELLFSSFFIHLCICQDRAIMTIIFSALVIVEKNWLGSFSSVDLVYWVWLVFCEFFHLACFGWIWLVLRL